MARSGYCSIVLNSQGIKSNTSSITVSGIITTSSGSYRGDHRSGTYSIYQGGVLIKSGSFTSGAPANSTTTLFSVSLVINHNPDGSSGAITASYNYDSGWCIGSGSLGLPSIKRASAFTLSASTVDFGETVTVTVDKQDSNFSHHLYYSLNSGAEVNISTNVGTSFDWTIPLELMNNIPYSTKASIKLRLYTLGGGAVIGWHDVIFTATVPAISKPSCSIEVLDVNGHEAKYGAFVKGKSKLKINVIPTLAYSSPITSYTVKVDGRIYTAADVETEYIQRSGSIVIEASVADKRGRSGSSSVVLNVLPYNAPNISLLKVQRCNMNGTLNDQGEYAKITINASVPELNNANTVSYKLEYKKTSETEYAEINLNELANSYLVVEHEKIFEADSGASYDVKLSVSDDFGTTTKNAVISTGFTLWNANSSGKGFAFGKVSEKDAFEVSMDMYDMFDTRIGNGLAVSNLTKEIDPDTTLEHLIFTNNKTPDGGYMFIKTFFCDTKSQNANRLQIAMPYVRNGSMYHRNCVDGLWSDWRRCINADEKQTKVVTATTIKTLSNVSYVDLTTFEEIQTAFTARYGSAPSDRHTIGISAMNGDYQALNFYVVGFAWYGTTLRLILNREISGSVRFNYCCTAYY